MRIVVRVATALFAFWLFLTPSVQAAQWCTVDPVPENVVKKLQADADKRSIDHPRAIARVHTEGTLPHQGIWDQSEEAKKDLPLIRDLALVWRSKNDQAVLDNLTVLLDAWATVYQPSFNPIDETPFDALIDAFAVTKSALPIATRNRVAAMLHTWAAGYIDQMQHLSGSGKGTATNNWQSHRIKIVTMAAVALDDERLFNSARELYRKHLNENLHANGISIDFEERDALHYTVYDLEPLIRAAMAARVRGEDWMTLRAKNGATLAAGLNWLLPYARGDKTHEEYVHTTVKFDRTRRDAGLAGFGGLWDPKTSGQLYWLASTLDTRYLSVARGLVDAAPWISACWSVRQ